jgi:hypothetical protein
MKLACPAATAESTSAVLTYPDAISDELLPPRLG